MPTAKAAQIAQLVEYQPVTLVVAGSSPVLCDRAGLAGSIVVFMFCGTAPQC